MKHSFTKVSYLESAGEFYLAQEKGFLSQKCTQKPHQCAASFAFFGFFCYQIKFPHRLLAIFLALFASTAQAQVFYEDFEGGTAPGWVEFDNGIGLTESWVLTNSGYNSSWSALIEYEVIGGSNSQDWLVTPLITPTAGNSTLSFFQKQSYSLDWGSSYSIRISTTSQSNPAAFTTIATYSETSFTTDYTLKTINLNAYIGTPIYIAFVMTQDDGDDWYVDDVTVGPMPCLEPTAVSVYSITSTTANFSWTELNGSTAWQVAVIDENTSIDPADIVNCPFNPVMMTGLVPGTAYDFYVRTNCGGGTYSLWEGPLSFQTTCLATFTAPYTQAFNGDAIPPCWTQSGSEPWIFNTNATYAAAAAGDHTANGGNYAFIDGSSPTGASQISTLTSPRVDVSGLARPALYFNVFSHNTDGTGYNTLTVQLFDGAAWQTVQTIQQDLGAGWREYIINLNNYTITGAVQVRFTIAENAASGPFYNDILIDDVAFKEGPTCYEVSNLSASGITSTAASLNWTAGDPGSSQWEIEVLASGATPTGTGVVTGTRPYAATGLTPATSYDFYVRERCGAGDNSAWIGPFTFTTLCGIYTAPYLQSFNTAVIPACWAQSGDNNWAFSTGADYGAASAGDHTSNGGRYAWIDGSNNDNGETSTLTSPLVDVSTLTRPALRYYVYSNNVDNPVLNTLTVEFFDGAVWHTVQTLQGNLGAGWFEVIINLSGYTITAPVRARFSVQGSTAFGTWFHDILIDDVEFYEGPLCITPSGLTASGITTTAANLSWTAGTGTQWDLELRLASEGLTEDGNVIDDNPFAQYFLEPGMTYHYAVREVCGVGDTSNWSPPFVFTTACPAPLLGNTLATAIDVNSTNFVDVRNTSRCYTNTSAGASTDVWYKLSTSSCTDSVDISLCNSFFDTYLYLYASDGTTLLNLNDDACGTRSQISTAVTGNTTYYILVEGFALEQGEFELHVDQFGVVALPNHTTTSTNVDVCQSVGTVTVSLSILGEEFNDYVVTRQWYDAYGNPQGSPQTANYEDPDHNPATPFVITKDTMVSQSGYFRFTVQVSRCGVNTNPVYTNAYIYVPEPNTLVMSNSQSQCDLDNRAAFVDFMDVNNAEPIASIMDKVGASDAVALGKTDVYVEFDATLTDCDGGALGIWQRMQRFWQITPETNDAAKVRLYFTQAELDALVGTGYTATALELWKFPDGSLCTGTPDLVPFTVIDFAASSYGYPNNKPFSSTAGIIGIEFDVTSFSHFVLVPNSSIFATGFLDFNAKVTGNQTVQLSWKTDNPQEFSQYEVFRSQDAITFQSIGVVQGQPQKRAYQFLDENPLTETSYYYITAKNNSGVGQNTDKKAVFIADGLSFELFPNPTHQQSVLNIRCQNAQAGEATAKVVDALGRVVQLQQFAITAGTQVYTLPIALPKGVYTLHWQTDAGVARNRTFVVSE